MAAVRASGDNGLPPNLIQNGTFAAKDKSGQLDGWTLLAGSPTPIISTDGSFTYATITNADASVTAGIRQDVPLNAEWSKMLVRGFVKVDEATIGPAASNPTESAGVVVGMKWIGDKGIAMPSVDSSVWTAVTVGAVEINRMVDVPTGARSLAISLEVNHVVGTADFRDMSLVGFVQTLDDEFDGATVDSSRWTISEGIHNVSTPEAQWFDPGHVSIVDGTLRIHAEQKPHGDLAYQSGEITSIGKFQQQYGLFEFPPQSTRDTWHLARSLPAQMGRRLAA